jgi:hypothetical protein
MPPILLVIHVPALPLQQRPDEILVTQQVKGPTSDKRQAWCYGAIGTKGGLEFAVIIGRLSKPYRGGDEERTCQALRWP